MQRSHAEVGKKIGLYNKKIKIYWTIKGLIILFIKLQFSIKCNQAFRLLCTSTSKHLPQYLSQPQLQYQRPDGLVTCIIPDAFVLSPIRLMIPDVHTAEVFTSNQVRSRPTCLLLGLGATTLPTKRLLSFLSLPWRSWRQSWHPHKGKVLAASSKAFIHTATKGCSRVIHLTLWQVGDLQEC